jgi:hypothetical protein
MTEYDLSGRCSAQQDTRGRSAEVEAGRIREFVIAHLRIEIRGASDLSQSDLLSTALNTVVEEHQDHDWWVRQGRIGAIAAVNARTEQLRAGRQ